MVGSRGFCGGGLGTKVCNSCADSEEDDKEIGPCARTGASTMPRMLRADHVILTSFFVFAMILIPLAVFAVAAFFAVLLWWIECDAYMHYVSADLASGGCTSSCSPAEQPLLSHCYHCD
jgi:hypothetical protein